MRICDKSVFHWIWCVGMVDYLYYGVNQLYRLHHSSLNFWIFHFILIGCRPHWKKKCFTPTLQILLLLVSSLLSNFWDFSVRAFIGVFPLNFILEYCQFSSFPLWYEKSWFWHTSLLLHASHHVQPGRHCSCQIG